MNLKKSIIIDSLNELIIYFEKKGGKNQFSFTTPIGLILGKLATEKDSSQLVSDDKINLGFAIKSYAKTFEKLNTDKEETLSTNESYIVLKDVTMIFTNGNRIRSESYVLFYDQIIGISLAEEGLENNLLTKSL